VEASGQASAGLISGFGPDQIRPNTRPGTCPGRLRQRQANPWHNPPVRAKTGPPLTIATAKSLPGMLDSTASCAAFMRTL